VILETRIDRSSQLCLVEKRLKSLLDGLDVQIVIRGTHGHGWVDLSGSGRDEKVAMQFLRENVGFSPSSLDDVHGFSVIKGFVAARSESKSELRLDCGFDVPGVVDVVVPLGRLQAQLVDGRKVALKMLVDLFGLCPGMPLHVRILRVEVGRRCVEAELSERQQGQFAGWVRSLLDRLLVFGCSLDEVWKAVRVSRVSRDVVGVESLGMFEHAVVCKLGTDAVGLVPQVGRVLRNSALTVFSPRRVVELLGVGLFSFD
jgi:hypothetical protein